MSEEKHDSVEDIQRHKNIYVKNKKPKFRRQETWRYKRVTDSWRKPHGVDSKMRKKVKGWPLSPTTGYCSPKKTRGMHPSGFMESLVYSVEDLNGLDPELQAIRIARTVGGRKRAEIMTLAEEKGLHVLNPRTLREPEGLKDSAESDEKESLSDGAKKN
jgi:large subunit ribosomal protein L32e